MTRDKISAWYRNLKFRAQHNYDVVGELAFKEVLAVVDHFNSKCVYCGEEATTLDIPFPLNESLLFVQANVVTSCEFCKRIRGHRDLVQVHNDGEIETDRYIEIVKALLSFNGNDSLRKWMKMLTGL